MQKDAERVVPCSRVFMAVSSFKRHGPNLKARRLEIQLMGLVACSTCSTLATETARSWLQAVTIRHFFSSSAGHKVRSLSRKIGQRLELGNSNSSHVSVSRCQPVSTCECHLWMLPVVIAGGATSTSSLMEVGCIYTQLYTHTHIYIVLVYF